MLVHETMRKSHGGGAIIVSLHWKSNSIPKKPKKNLSSSSETKVMITLVSEELERFFLGFLGYNLISNPIG